MARTAQLRRGRLLLGIVLGLLVFAAGAVPAGIFLPEWRTGDPLPEEAFRDRYAELVARVGLALAPGEPRIRVVTRDPSIHGPIQGLMDAEGGAGSPHLLRVEVFHAVRGPREGRLGIDFTFDGRPLTLAWWGSGLASLFERDASEDRLGFAESLASLLLAPGESLGSRRTETVGAYPQALYPVLGSRPPDSVLVSTSGNVMAQRLGGPPTEERREAVHAAVDHAIALFGRGVLAFAGVAALFAVLLLKARIGVANGAALALAALLTLNPLPSETLGWTSWSAAAVALTILWIFLLWSSAESLLRTAAPEFTTSLDALRAGRLGPRGGRGLLLGFAFGAALAGLRLGLPALAAVLPGTRAVGLSLRLPISQALSSPVADGIGLAAGVALALALALRFLPVRWAPPAAALVAAAVLSPLAIEPWPAALAADLAVTGLLVLVVRRHGLTALLTASVVSLLLPPAVFAALHLSWLPGTFAVTTGLGAAVVLLGFLGLPRSAQAEVQRLAPPAFVRRLEEEKRLKNEMGLLARMQRGLLPKTLPRLGGWEIAARSLLANEAGGDLYDFLPDDNGRLWIAAGDVAGHGYSCAVAQAMTKAALASLVGRGERTPAGVLGRADRVLRAAGATRNFTTLALLRLEPATGEALLANAGHPFPLFAAPGRVEELALPGLPLGRGPARTYQDRPLSIPPGGVLVFFSDGLFEAADRSGDVYGYDRIREVLESAADRPAEKILDAFLADWRGHLRGARPLDDTTLVVIKRTGRGSSGP
ncbi:MAG TPA: PP2C family protein-serine/threonine phosphatase [Thermoanaerobaculia bacterium]|nr:PP2C family protein-serine/threonine phosphatase [Thermoanaerobaculia bacterium]